MLTIIGAMAGLEPSLIGLPATGTCQCPLTLTFHHENIGQDLPHHKADVAPRAGWSKNQPDCRRAGRAASLP